MKHVVIIGGGFAGLNVAKELGNRKEVRVTLLDKHNFHLFQPLLYQVAMAALNAGEIAYPLRMMLSKYKNVTVLKGIVKTVDPVTRTIFTDFGELSYDTLVMACGTKHHYFGHNEWEEFAPGLKTIAQAAEIRRRVMEAYENAERSLDPEEKKKLLTFVIVGGGPTGVELAGSIGEMSRHYLSKYFKNIDPTQIRIYIAHSAPRILQTFSPELSAKATEALAKLGVEVLSCCVVTKIDENGVQIGTGRIDAGTVLWAAGVRATSIGKTIGFETDRSGRIIVGQDLSVPGNPDVFIGGDQAHFELPDGSILPGLASVALQEGQAIGRNILNDIQGKPRKPFVYNDKGQMATIGKNIAIAERGNVRLSGLPAWIIWLAVHLYYLSGAKHRLFVLLQWGWSYFTFGHGARIVNKEWRFYPTVPEKAEPAEKEELVADQACLITNVDPSGRGPNNPAASSRTD